MKNSENNYLFLQRSHNFEFRLKEANKCKQVFSQIWKFFLRIWSLRKHHRHPVVRVGTAVYFIFYKKRLNQKKKLSPWSHVDGPKYTQEFQYKTKSLL